MTTTWRYNAVSTNGAGPGAKRRGEMNGTSAAEIRASLRRIGWQVLDLKPVRSRTAGDKDAFGALWHGHLRSRRREIRAEIFDSAATMLESGVPVLQAVTKSCKGVALSPLPLQLVAFQEPLERHQGPQCFDDSNGVNSGQRAID